MEAYILKSTLLLGIFLGAYYLLLSREKMHRFNRFYLLGSLLFSLLLPVITIPVYVEVQAPVTQPVLTTIEMPPTQISEATPQVTKKSLPHVMAEPVQVKQSVNYFPYALWGGYGLVALLLAIRFTVNIVHFYRKAKRNKQITLHGARVVLLYNCPLPYTFINFIFVNKSQYEGQTIEPELFTHELAHVHQKHTLDILFVELLKTVFWFNPLLYLYKKAIQTNHEFLADDAVINQHLSITTYQLLLLDKATPPLAYALASSINFSTTKKRFTMMTKTTTKRKGLLLQSAMLPLVAGLVYFFSIQTITYAKTAEGKTYPTTTLNLPAVSSTTAPLPTAVTDTSIARVVARAAKATQSDTIVGDARRDEYFKGVRIIIDDAKRGIKIDALYENVSLDNRRYYLNNVPSKKTASLMPEVDYKWFVENKDAYFFIDEKKVTYEQFLQYKKEDFANYSTRMYWESTTVKITQVYLFTYPFFEEKLKHINDHYPDETYTLTVTKKPIDTVKEQLAEWKETDPSGKTNYEKEMEENLAKAKAPTYNYIDELKNAKKDYDGRFLGKEGSFTAYVNKNIQLPEKYREEGLTVAFSVNTDGSVSDVEIFDKQLKVDRKFRKRIERVFTSSPGFIPVQRNGRPERINTLITIGKDKFGI